jgi:hypothetical protein
VKEERKEKEKDIFFFFCLRKGMADRTFTLVATFILVTVGVTVALVVLLKRQRK